jgi:hypothetical protein
MSNSGFLSRVRGWLLDMLAFAVFAFVVGIVGAATYTAGLQDGRKVNDEQLPGKPTMNIEVREGAVFFKDGDRNIAIYGDNSKPDVEPFGNEQAHIEQSRTGL